MVVVPLAKPVEQSKATSSIRKACPASWVSIAAAGTLAAGGALILSGKPRAGMATAAAGTALIMLDQQEAVRRWWNALPGYLAEIQDTLGRVQTALDDISAQRERLHKLLTKQRAVPSL
jgi:hypothetical protein